MKLMIFGIPGSGKTSLAHKISEAQNLPIFHIDRHFFEPGWIERDHDNFLRDVEIELQKEHWLIEGNAMKSLEMRFAEADVAIYCALPRLLCLYRVFYRWISTIGKGKADGPDGADNSVSWRLVRYLWHFSQRYETKIAGLRKKYPNVRFIEIRSRKQMKRIEQDPLY